MKTIVVTGGAGFIGSHLCDRLIELGYEVVAIDNLSLGRKENIAHLATNPHFRFYQEDLLNAPEVLRIFREHRIEAVFHMAANSNIAVSHADPSIDLNNTFLTTYHVLEAMRIAGIKPIVFASTSAVYGETSCAVDENYGPLVPISHYGAAKLAAEGFVSSFVENYGLQSWIIRFPNVVGSRLTHGAVFDFIRKLKTNPHELEVLGDGRQSKPYIDVNDLIDATLLAWTHSHEPRNVFNVAVHQQTTVSEIAEMVVAEMGGAAHIRYTGGDRGWIGDVPSFSYDTRKIEALGWKPKYTSNEAVLRAVRAACSQI